MGRFLRGRKFPVAMVPPSVGGDKGGRRYLPDTRTAVVLPTTFADKATTIASFRASFAANALPRINRIAVNSTTTTTTTTTSLNPPVTPVSSKALSQTLPFRLYEITLRRGMVGLTSRIRRDLMGLGFVKRHQVVWRRVSPDVAGRILRVKELVDVKLVNEVPEKIPIPLGFKKLESTIGRL